MLLRIFAVQVPLYGLGIILTGMLQAHRRFLAAALAPLASVDRRARVLPLVRLDRRRPGRAVAGQRRGDPGARLGHHARRRRAVGAADRAGDAHRLALAPGAADAARGRPPDRRPRRGRHHRPGRPAGRRRRRPCGCPSESGDHGTFTVYTYAQAVYLLPYAVLAVPVATSAFPALAARSGAGEDVTRHPRAHPAGRARPDRALGGRARSPRPPPIGAFFSLLDARARRRRHEHRRAGGPAGDAHRLRAGPGRLRPHRTAHPGAVRARPADRCRLAAALGWSLAALLPLVVLAGGQSPAITLRWLGIGVDARHDGVGHRARAARAPHLGHRGHPGRRAHHRGARRRGGPRPSRSATSSPTAAPSTACPRRCSSAWRPAGSPSWWGWSRCRSATAR